MTLLEKQTLQFEQNRGEFSSLSDERFDQHLRKLNELKDFVGKKRIKMIANGQVQISPPYWYNQNVARQSLRPI